jgi:Cu-Zn family superoxide dismutase
MPGTHGIHLHMTGTCDAPFTTAGAHWNPTARQHGLQNAAGPHLGDLPNIEVGADSSANVQVSATGGTLRGADGLLDADGAAIIVHATADDNKTDPSGNSGARIACGVVKQ